MTRVAWGILRLVPCSSSANFCYQKPRRSAATIPARIICDRSLATAEPLYSTNAESCSSARSTATSTYTLVVPALHSALAPAACGSQTSRDGQYALDLPWRSLAGLFYPTFCRRSPRRSQPLTGLARSLQDGCGALQTFLPSSHFFLRQTSAHSLSSVL